MTGIHNPSRKPGPTLGLALSQAVRWVIGALRITHEEQMYMRACL